MITGIIIGFLTGTILTFIIIKLKFDKNKKDWVSKNEIFKSQLNQLSNEKIINEQRGFDLQNELNSMRKELETARTNIIVLNSKLSAKDADYKNLNTKLDEQKAELEQLYKKFNTEFENLANKIFEEKSQKFTQQNKTNIDEILHPLNEKIKDFEKKIDDTYEKGLKDQTALQAELLKLHDLNNRISLEASNLTKALKGDVKKQGNWGEMILDRILENSGLIKDEEYKTQVSIKDDKGSRYQPDVVVYLPDKKNIIIDSKVSLVAYEHWVNAETEAEKEKYIKEHLTSIKNHIKELSEKKYQLLEGLNTPEYVLLFVPIEASFSIAIQEDKNIFNYAWNNKIVIVSPSTLIATLMTVASIWKQENQTKNAIEIARQSGALYDKFVGLLNDLIDVGKKLDSTQNSYKLSMKKLSEGSGNLIHKIETIKKLGAKSSKEIPQKLIDRAIEQE
ncbi:MAG: DNA recombination protein RmuC [Bacteroidales bacterium]|nr:DNA recombination protein RmuC [Bacteroidales bacterium]